MAPPKLSDTPDAEASTSRSACAEIRSIPFASMTHTTPTKSPRTRPLFPGNLTDLNRFRKTVHGHDGSSRIVMVRKTDQRTFASMKKGEQPKLETITRETIETFCGQRTEYKVTTEKKDEQKSTEDLIIAIVGKNKKPEKNGITQKNKPPPMDDQTKHFERECLTAHNQYRKKHGLEPLKLNQEICKESQAWADNLIKRGILEHRPDNKYGENVYCVQFTNPNFTLTGDEPVHNWYREIETYTFGTEPYDLTSGHFTQVIWKDSKELGVGIARTNRRIIVVVNYFPPGNIIGEFTKNVFPVGELASENNNIVDDLSHLTLLQMNSFCEPKKGTGVDGNFPEDCLAAHNEYRLRHSVPPLELDAQLCKYADEWATILAAKNVLEHRRNSPYGENIYCMYTNDPNFKITGHTPVDTWYEEMKKHVFNKEPASLKTGHFTQVVWKSSKLLGIGVSKSRQGYIYVVANYSPAGNFIGEYVKNVLSPVDEMSSQSNTSPTTETRTISEPSVFVSGSGDYNTFQMDSLKVHNEYRRKHGVPPLKLSKELCLFSKAWAEECAKTKNMSHRPNNKYGENMFSMYSSDFSHLPSARDVVKKWYDEVEEYIFGAERINYGTLHFTQVVWKGTTEMGIDMAVNDKGYTYVVANYSPRGNVVGQFVSNVPKAKV